MKSILPGIALLSLTGLAGADVILTGSAFMNTTAAGLYDASPAAYDQVQTTAVNGLNTTAIADFNGVNNATSYDFALTGATGHLLVDFQHSSQAVAGQYGEPHNQAFISFSVTDAPVEYYLSGAWAGDFQWSQYNVQLSAGKSGIFGETQNSSDGSADFTLGLGGSATGALSGVLGIGSYNLIYNISDQTALGAAGNSTGYVRLDFGAPAPAPVPTGAVPEPSSWAFMGLGLFGLLIATRRFKQA